MHRWFPSIDADRCSNVAVGYSVSSPSMFPGTAVTGRQNRDAPGTMRTEVIAGVGRLEFWWNHPDYAAIFGREMVQIAAEHDTVVALTAAMPDGTVHK